MPFPITVVVFDALVVLVLLAILSMVVIFVLLGVLVVVFIEDGFHGPELSG